MHRYCANLNTLESDASMGTQKKTYNLKSLKVILFCVTLTQCYYSKGFSTIYSDSKLTFPIQSGMLRKNEKRKHKVIPSVGDKNIINMTQPVAAWQRTVWQLLFVQFPG